MPSEKQPFYDPVPPTYDEALASSSRGWEFPVSSTDEREIDEAEAESLLPHAESSASSSQRPNGYRPPTVETDDEDSLFGSVSDGDDDEEAAHVRREMQEMEIEEPPRLRRSIWRKRISLRLSLPRWKWSWRPRLPRLRIRLPSRTPASDAEDGDNNVTRTEPRRWGWPAIDNLTMILVFARIIALIIIVGVVYFLFASGIFGGLSSRLNAGMRFDPEDLRLHIQRSVEPMRLRASVQHFSNYAHMAGTEGDYATALDVQSMFNRAGLDKVDMDEYYVYVNYPTKDGRTVQILDEKGDKPIWTARLEEKEGGKETAGRQTYAFHGHSKSGDVKGPLIYANYGSRDDFKWLRDRGVNTKGAVALVRYYGTESNRALKVKAAELAGFAGCITYSDPADDGFLKGEVAPHGRFMPSDGVQLGAVSLVNWVVGDVLTPGWESKKDMPRMKVNETAGLVKIPSLPLAWRDAQMLLRHIKGHGERAPKAWQGGVPDVGEWWTGDGSTRMVRLKNEQVEIEQQPIWNVYGKIIGMEQTAKSIIVGNHRDAWAFGATDPHSGTAIMIELARIFGDLLSRGWRPLRTIEFMSWDAEEYNLIGSTEFVENNLERLRESAYAYINLDTAVAGTEFRATGSPALQKALLRALSRVTDPNTNATLRQAWNPPNGRMGGPGARGDYVAFQDIAGTSSLDLKFTGERFPSHSSYDNFDLVEKVIDPGFVHHTLMGQVVGLIMLDLADRAILPFDLVNYAEALRHWVEELGKWIKSKGGDKDESSKLPLHELEDAVTLVKMNAETFEKWELEWDRQMLQGRRWKADELGASRMVYNDKMAAFETALLDLELGGGVSCRPPTAGEEEAADDDMQIPNRTQFKHVVFGPQLWSGDDEAFFPAIRDPVEAGDWVLARRIIAKTATILRLAATVLQMDK
ncbi:Transferrin receptor-like, dimerization domain protein [Drechmeria coniospora]|uniref:Transferrin receptor-like, dimerization domain protein n=1 Tax=Drechmeria coniospora TaxID=98403 RepID=A0A151GBR1_DRECN|nr:Transferrin receptor-like, dimerization domain protein [Drechmeria coniospora]KYK54493.1 Transferrin receptor-like, dimerization domain protein [Drechmeria coniospora]